MSREVIIPIRKFGGMIPNPQQEDIPDFASVWNQNVDPTFQGQLRGIKDNGTAYQANGNVEIPDATESVFIMYNDSGTMKWDLVYLDKEDNDISVVEDFYNSEANRTFNDLVTSPTGTASSIGIFGNSAQVGMGNGDTEIPYTVYRLLNDRKFFNDAITASAGMLASYGICDNRVANLTVSALTAASPIVVTVTANHGFLTGQLVAATGSTPGFTGFIGVYTIIVLSDTTFSLDGSSGSGTWSSGGIIRSGYCAPESVALQGEAAAADYFQADTQYAWGVSVIYDGLQESNLITVLQDGTLASNTNVATSTTADIQLRSYQQSGIFSNALWDKRITAVKLYRAESPDNNIANLGLYRLVKTIDINKGVDELNWAASGVSYDLIYADSGGYPAGGATYEEETGIYETTERTYVHYGLNTVGGGYHWMAQPYVPTPSITGGVPTAVDWDRHIFRSQKFRPNMVDWANDFFILPEIPVDMKYYNDVLYAFTENKIYPINPELLIVGEPFEGVGVSARGGIKVTEYGMFFCNINGAYRLFNNQLTTISNPIKTTMNTTKTNESWEAFAIDAFSSPGTIGRIIVGYLPDKRSILFIGQAPAASTTLAFVYYLPTGEWYIWTLGAEPLDANSGLVTGKDGELYWSGTTTLNKLLGASGTYLDFDWLSKEFTLGKPSQNKLWKKIIWDSTGTVVVKRGVEGTHPATSVTNDTYFNDYQKTQQILLDCTTSATVDSLDILVRELIGVR